MSKRMTGWASLLGLSLAIGSTAWAQEQEEARLAAKISQVAFTQGDLPAGWTVMDDRTSDSTHYNELSELISMLTTLRETSSVNLGHAITAPEGTFNVEYFAFQNTQGAITAEPYFKNTAKEHNWLTFRVGDVMILATTGDRAVQAALVQGKLIPFLERLLAESLEAEKAGNIALAEQGYFNVVQAAPVYAQAWLRLGTIYQRAKPPKASAALNAYSKALEAHRSSPSLGEEDLWQAMIGFGCMNLIEGNLDTALGTLEQARLLGGKLGPSQEAKSDYFIAAVYAAKNDEGKMAEYLEAAFEIQKSEGKSELVQQAMTDPTFEAWRGKKKLKKLLKKFGKG